MREPREERLRRIGVYGGTFDPIHNGHLRVAAAIVEAFALERLLFVPAFVPPHKRARAVSASYHRYAMAVLATLDQPALMVSTIELERPAQPYTIETLGRLQAANPGAQLFFVMGADSFADVTSWREHQRLLREHRIIVAVRPGYRRGEALTAHLTPRLQAQVVDLRGGQQPRPESLAAPQIYLTDYVTVDVSATGIRKAVAESRPIEQMVPPAVAGYIAKYGLYRKDE
jgi:nicotinate-nucleotide adenylyltransferase